MADQVENPVDPPKSEEPLTEAQKEEEAAKCA